MHAIDLILQAVYVPLKNEREREKKTIVVRNYIFMFLLSLKVFIQSFSHSLAIVVVYGKLLCYNLLEIERKREKINVNLKYFYLTNINIEERE